MPNISEQDILTYLRTRGPSVSNDIRKGLSADSMVLGATISNLLQKKVVKQTAIRLGSSVFYYLPGQEQFLEKLIQHHNPKDQPIVRRLKEEQVLRDRDLELFERVSIRQTKDFAKEVVAKVPGGQILFWRYYLLSESAAIDLIKQKYWKTNDPKKDEQQTPSVEQQVQQEKPSVQALEQSSSTQEEQKQPEQERQKQVSPVEDKTEPSQSKNEQEQQVTTSASPQSTHQKQETQTALQSEIKQPQAKLESGSIDKTAFYDDIIAHFRENKIVLLQQEQITKDREYAFIIEVPSAVGIMKMYCRARNKKKLNEGDVAQALLKAKLFDLPCLYLTNGEFTKKAQKIIAKEYNGVILQFLK
jgi:hypothetical protein